MSKFVIAMTLAVFSAAAGSLATGRHHDLLRDQCGPGKGADLGGLEGADRHCQQLAETIGAGGKKLAAGSCKLRANILTIVFVDATGLQHSNSKEPELSI
jgi:hypothetical protein